jgi:hypothetical protein
MKLSANTVAVLKNFCNVNANLVIEPGKVIRTIGPSRNIFAAATVEDDFPRQVAIYDLNSFLATVTLFDNVDLDFSEKYMVVKSGDAMIKYFYSDPSIVQAAPNKEITLDEELFSFNLTADEVNAITKVSAILSAPTLSLTCADGKVNLTVSDRKNDTSHSYLKEVGSCGTDFDVRLRVDEWKIMPGDYSGTVARKKHKDGSTVGVVRWVNKTIPLTYFMTVDTNSKV